MTKKRLLILVVMIISFKFGFSTSCVFSHYVITDGIVVYTGVGDNKVLKGVDIETFKGLDQVFAADKNKVYYLGKHLKDIDAGTFEVIGYAQIADEKNLERWILGCQSQNIKEFKDKNGTYKLEDIQTGKLKLEE